ncbi:hypothetical protein, partial [uncultured Corynebacterium sp.]|uniref:hypothetical protein n=1 Tax=uncultured Corynebacterium sp. TaxID=159447 RepID=UPI00261BF088
MNDVQRSSKSPIRIDRPPNRPGAAPEGDCRIGASENGHRDHGPPRPRTATPRAAPMKRSWTLEQTTWFLIAIVIYLIGMLLIGY